MSIQALSEYTFQSRYSQYNHKEERKETWEEAVERIFDMHRTKYCDEIESNPELAEYIDFAQQQYKKKRTLGSQRALQYGGDPILQHMARLYNCTGFLVDKPKSFQDIVYVLMAGCGAGYSTQYHHVNKLPKIAKPNSKTKTYVVPDTCEGWADSIGVLLSSYFVKKQTFKDYNDYTVKFDFSQIRPKGALIAGRFKAPGPDPLEAGLEKIRALLDKCLSEGQTKLSPLNVHDIICHAADFVISAGLRRSALINLFSPEDTETASCKTGDWFTTNPQRARANNSVIIERSNISKEKYLEIMENVKIYGEPGVYFVEDQQSSTCNPCCVGKETIVFTDKGPRPVKDLIDKQFNAIVDSEDYMSTEKGFFYTGDKELFEIDTKEGYQIQATADHRVMLEDGEWTKVQDLNKDSKVKLHAHQYEWSGQFSEKEGWIAGSYLGDGTQDTRNKYLDFWDKEADYMPNSVQSMLSEPNSISISSSVTNTGIKKVRIRSTEINNIVDIFGLNKKQITSAIWKNSSESLKGFIAGWFDADGSVQGDHKKGCSARITSTSLNNLKFAQQILHKLGIYSRIYKERHQAGKRSLPDGNGGLKDYECKATHELAVANNSLAVFYDQIPLKNKDKCARLKDLINSYKRTPNKNANTATINTIKSVGVHPVYDCTIPEVAMFDGNGFILHNCEIGFWPELPNGETGTSFCNLTDINGSYCDTEEKFYEQCRASAVIGTLQAGYDQFPYLGETTEEIVQTEALLGCSITGWMSNPHIFFDKKILRKGVKIIKEVNEKMAKMLGINPAARITCAKPSGSTSTLLGTSSGIHPHHSKRYIRRVQSNVQDSALQHFKQYNPEAVETSVWNPNGTDEVISFVCEVPKGAIVKNQISAVEFLEKIKFAQQHWVIPGTVPERGLNPNITHNISNTVVVQDDEWDEVLDFIYENRQYFSGISLLPASGDLNYPQAPFSTVLTPTELVREYGDASVFASGLVVDGLSAFNDNLWAACDCAMGIGEDLNGDKDEPEYPKKRNYKDLAAYFVARETYDQWDAKKDWVRRIKQFADRYFDGDLRRATYCCKHVSLWKTWCDLQREYQEVPWEKMECEQEFVEAGSLTAQACSGGACELV